MPIAMKLTHTRAAISVRSPGKRGREPCGADLRFMNAVRSQSSGIRFSDAQGGCSNADLG